jgi:predicted transcriptional regulator
MIVSDIVESLGLTVAAGAQSLEREITGGYAADLLSCVMAGAAAGNLWVTLQAHPNVVAVADLLGLAGVIITEGTAADEATLSRAEERGVPILLAQETTFSVVARLAEHGINGNDAARGA